MKTQLENYNPKWPDYFLQLKKQIWPRVSAFALDLIHVGSTSIVGMSAKPIIDLDIVVKDFSQFEKIKLALEGLDYQHNGNQGIDEREAFIDLKTLKIKHHLYVIKKESTAFKNHIHLKKHLQENPTSFQKYKELKEKLVNQGLTPSQYWLAKTEMILAFLEKEKLDQKSLDQIRAENS